jgi:uroporphyrinogen-III synthase
LPPDVVAQISAGVVDAIMVSSPNVGRVLATSLDPESIVQISSGRTAVVAISPLTAQACRDAGLEVSAVADEATDEGMIEALLQSRSRSAFQPR